ncbi:MAG: M15 family metallopeptidase [Bacteroidetes bacterium]|nr:M15 family metallopeptidase [Bacteroidota bacterium]
MKPTRITTLFVLILFTFSLNAQKTKRNPYTLNIISSTEVYSGLIKNDSLKRLVDLQKTVAGIVLDIRYATSNNFTHKKVYTSARAYARLKVARALTGVQSELSKRGLGLKVFDAYRPYAATLLFWDIIHDTAFVASPVTGSRHNRGCAVDVSLVDLKTGKELVMPTPYDDFTAKASSGYQQIPDEAKLNRHLLITAMAKYGFTVYPSEWWHFDFPGWKDYELMDLSFEELDTIKR